MTKISDDLRQILTGARRVVAVTGAGISAESGVPTFREAQTGLWEQYDPTELATPEAFERDPTLVWCWYCWRRDKVLAVEPNAGHHALVQLGQMFPEFCLTTQNVDRLHQRAGSHDVLELHGSIMQARCAAAGHPSPEWPNTKPDQGPPPCDQCGSLLRPAVVWFGEALPADTLTRAMQAASHCDVLFSIGTSSLVYPAAGLADSALQSGATVVEINPQETPLSSAATFVLRGPAGEVLPALVDQLKAG